MTATPSQPRDHPGPADPLVDEVRALKRAASERFGHDLQRIAGHLREIERARASPPLQPPQTQPAGKVA